MMIMMDGIVRVVMITRLMIIMMSLKMNIFIVKTIMFMMINHKNSRSGSSDNRCNNDNNDDDR